jgi:hypothetical protein
MVHVYFDQSGTTGYYNNADDGDGQDGCTDSGGNDNNNDDDDVDSNNNNNKGASGNSGYPPLRMCRRIRKLERAARFFLQRDTRS